MTVATRSKPSAPDEQRGRVDSASSRSAGPVPSRAILEHQAGAVLTVVVTPQSSRTAFDRWDEEAIRIRVAAPPVEGAANAALVRFIATSINRPLSSVSVIGGATGRRKRILISGIAPADLTRRLTPLLSPSPVQS